MRDVVGQSEATVTGRSIDSFLDDLAARTPAPGGGATAAVHLAQAAALLGMVARYSTGEKYAANAECVAEIVALTDSERANALRLAEADARAFSEVAEAYRLPRSTDAEREVRHPAIAAALGRAAQPPADVVGVCTVLIGTAERLLPIANPTVLTDVAAASEAARAAATTARLNIEVNLGGIHDDEAKQALHGVVADVDDVVRRAAEIEREVRSRLVR